MDKNIYHLSYVSTAMSGLSFDTFQSILEVSAKNNEARNITGILVYCNNHFFQILEGAKNDVLSIYESIIVDYRHDNLIKLQEGLSDTRLFEDWSMAFKSYNSELQQLDNFNNEEFYTYVNKQIRNANHLSLKILVDFFDLNGHAEFVSEKIS